MNCPKCNTKLTEGTLFCPGCGTAVSKFQRMSDISDEPTAPLKAEEMQRTMTIPVIRDVPPASQRPATAPRPVQQRKPYTPAADGGPRRAQTSDNVYTANQRHTASDEPESSTRRNLLIFFIVFFSVVLIGLLVFIGIMMRSNVSTTADTGTGRSAKIEETAKNEKKIHKSEEKDISEDDEKKAKAKTKKSKKTGSSSNSKNGNVKVKVDTGFDFAYGVTLDDAKPDYTTLTSRDYSYKCDFPSDFEYEFDDGEEIRYAAADDTAYMDIGAGDNELGLTAAEVKADTEAAVGGTVTYEAIGDDWYAMSIEKDGIAYYQKCFVDEYIRYFEIVCPSEYVDVYDDYITDIEATFKRTE